MTNANSSLEIELIAIYNALEQNRITLEMYYRRYAALCERHGEPAYTLEREQTTWAEWLAAVLMELNDQEIIL